MSEHNEIQTGVIEEHIPPHKEEGGGGLLQIDGTIIFIAVSFVIFTVVMQKVFYGPILRIIEKRKKHLKSIKDSADEALNKAEELTGEYTKKINAARKKVADNTTNLMAEANQEKAKIFEEKKQVIAEFLTENRAKIQEEKTETTNELKQNIDSYAADIFRKVING